MEHNLWHDCDRERRVQTAECEDRLHTAIYNRAYVMQSLKPGYHYPSSRLEFTGRVDGPSTQVHFLTPVNSARELEPWTWVVETGLNDLNVSCYRHCWQPGLRKGRSERQSWTCTIQIRSTSARSYAREDSSSNQSECYCMYTVYTIDLDGCINWSQKIVLVESRLSCIGYREGRSNRTWRLL